MTDRLVYKDIDFDMDIKRTLSVYNVMSAIGKTYLPYALRYIQNRPRFVVYSNKEDYDSFKKNPWVEGRDVVYFFDRFDLLHDEQVDKLISACVDTCILLDLKNILTIEMWHVEYEGVILERPDARRFVLRNGYIF